MAEPHPSLFDLAAGRPLPAIDDLVAVARSALEHKMGGLLLAELEARRPDGPARAPVLRLLRSTHAATRNRHERLWSELATVTEVMAGLGIDVAVAKGVVAEARWYDRMGDRPCNDLDLLVSPEHVSRIDDAIAALEPSHPLRGRVGALAASGAIQTVDLVHGGVPVDLHWDLLKLGIPSRARELLWSRTVPFVASDGRTLRVLDAESSLLHFLVHLNKDRFARLLNFVDIARIVEQEELDTGVVCRLAAADGISASVSATWNVVHDTLGLPAARTPEGAAVRRAVWLIAWPPSIRLRGTEAKLRFLHRQWLIAFLAVGRLREAAAAFVRAMFPPPDLLAYLHSSHAERVGAPTVAATPRGHLIALTVGRVQVRLARRRAARAARRPVV